MDFVFQSNIESKRFLQKWFNRLDGKSLKIICEKIEIMYEKIKQDGGKFDGSFKCFKNCGQRSFMQGNRSPQQLCFILPTGGYIF